MQDSAGVPRALYVQGAADDGGGDAATAGASRLHLPRVSRTAARHVGAGSGGGRQVGKALLFASREKMAKRVCRKRFVVRGAPLSVNAIALRRGQRAKPILAASMRCKAVPRDHAVNRVARNAEQLSRTMAVAMGLPQGPYQRTFRRFVDHGVE